MTTWTEFLLYIDQLNFLEQNPSKTGLKMLAAGIFYKCSLLCCWSVFSGSHAFLGGWLVARIEIKVLFFPAAVPDTLQNII